MRIVTIVGARPQFIKAAPVSRALRAQGEVREILVHTGQHYDYELSQVFFDELEIPAPDYNLGVGSASHGAQTARMLEAIEQCLIGQKPDWTLVYGDTNSTLAGALAAVKLHIPIAHVEAGLRSFNRAMPEEVNRVLTDHAADVLFAPTTTALMNLRQEGIPKERIRLVGDTMYDAALFYAEKARQRRHILDTIGVAPNEYVLATVHRAENTDNIERLRVILQGLGLVAKELPVVLPLHPRTRGVLGAHPSLLPTSDKLTIIDPVGYLDMMALEIHACVIATDSGGIQKEAYFHRVPCVTLREETEWVELIETGWNRLAPPLDKLTVYQTIKEAVNSQGQDVNLYGDGHAAERIVDCLLEA